MFTLLLPFLEQFELILPAFGMTSYQPRSTRQGISSCFLLQLTGKQFLLLRKCLVLLLALARSSQSPHIDPSDYPTTFAS